MLEEEGLLRTFRRRGRLGLAIWGCTCVEVRLFPPGPLGLGEERFVEWRKAWRSILSKEMGGGVEVTDEVVEFRGNVNGREEEVIRWVEASGGTIRRVEGCVDISGDEDTVVCIQSLMNSSEDLVGLSVPTSSGPPALDNTVVITVDLDSGKRARLENSVDEELHGDGFGPSDVPSILVPTW